MNPEEIGKYIKKLRLKNNLSQKELADKLSVTFQAVSKWERGISIPDIYILKEISNIFNVDINEIIGGKETPNKNVNKKNKTFRITILLLIVIVIIGGIFLIRNINFKLTPITTSCDDFKISGSAAYNKEKSSIYISNISYCGKEDNTKYKNIECILYESYKDTEKKISTCNSKQNITLDNYLKDTIINTNNYSYTCKEFTKSKLYLIITATDSNNKNIIYKIPISIEDNCNKK